MSAALPHAMECDVLVIGSGAGGLAAAVTAASAGARVILIEKAAQFGGTTAWSGGWMWIPGNPQAAAAGVAEKPGDVRTYLRSILGKNYSESKIEAYLAAGPQMLAWMEAHTALRFQPGSRSADFYGNNPGAATGWRSVTAAPFNGARLGRNLSRLRQPLPEMTLWGMEIAPGPDLTNFLTCTTSFPAMLHVLKRLGQYGGDLLRHGQAMHFMNGHALAAALLLSAQEKGVTLWHSSAAHHLLHSSTGITGAVIERPNGQHKILARRGVILATGGFPHDPMRQAALLPHVTRNGTPHHSAAPSENTGDGLKLGEAAGGYIDSSLVDNAAWAPVSLVPHRDGSVCHFPHLMERGKPGLIAVTASGRRFANESGSYHGFMRALFAAVPAGETAEAWLIVDSRFLRRYGLGAVKPWPFPHQYWLASGYLRQGRTMRDLAHACGIDPDGLTQGVESYNRHAVKGEDPVFGRGSTPYERGQGDARQHPNPCVAPLNKGPFFAVRIVPGSLGTFAGLATDASARVLDNSGTPIRGLFAVGNDASSIMGGHYPSGGITLGPALTFGWLAGRLCATTPQTDTPTETTKTDHDVSLAIT